MGSFEQAEKKFRDWRGKLIERLHRENLPEREIEVLLRPPRREHFPKVLVSYLSFPVWLAKYDHALTRGLAVNLNSYRAQKNKHVEDVIKQLDIVAGEKIRSLTAKALFDEINRSGFQILILPYVFWEAGPLELKGDLFVRFGMNQTTLPTDIKAGSPATKSILTTSMDGMPDKVNNAWTAGDGTDSIINYTPHMFDSDQHGSGTSGIHGPALETDEVLFHELVHAARTIHGWDSSSEKVNKGYTNEEEYLAIVVSNVYLSEKGKRNYRAGHDNRAVLPDPEGFLNNAQNVNLSPRDLIARFRMRQLEFYQDLADIPADRAAFNPIRQFDEELKAKKKRP